MRNALRQLAVLLCCAMSAAFAQVPAKPAPTLDAIVAMEDANSRITALQQFLKANPNNDKTVTAREALVASYGQLGENHLNENNIEKAVDAFQRAFKALPKQVSEKFFKETVVLIPLAVAARGYLSEAIGLAKLLETRFANDAERLGAIGEFYATFNAAGEAITALEAAAKLAPEDARLHRALGEAYRKALRLDEAIASYQLAVRFDAKDRRAFYDLADLYRSQGAYDDALKLYRRQLDIEPKHTPSLKGIALVLTAQGKDDQAAAVLNQARDLAGSLNEITQDQLLQTQLAFYYLAQNKLREAQRAADAALSVEPRYSWARIAAAEILLAQGKFFEAERHLIEAQKLAGFPTLWFTLGKVYLIVEDFDGAAEQFAKAFRYSSKTQFTTRLGGIRDVQGDDLRELLAPEHQAALFLAEAPTSDEIFRIAESLVRVNAKLAEAEASNKDGAKNDQLDTAAKNFVEAESSRRSYRALHMATKLAQAGRALPLAIKLADQSLDLAEVATEVNGSVRDYPNYDRAGRFHVFRGRAYDARGWALFKSGRTKDSLIALSQAVVEYGNLPEGKRALWHLATAHEAAGAQAQALELYLAAYEPPDAKSKLDIQRTVIETIYRKVHQSLDGLEAKLGQPVSAATLTDLTTTSLQAGTTQAGTAQAGTASTEVVAKNTEPPAALAPPPMVATKPEPKSGNLNLGLPLKREAETLTVNQPKPVEPKTAAPPAKEAAKEPERLGLFGIPVSSKTARPSNKPAITTPPKAATEIASVIPKSEPPVVQKPVVQKNDAAQVTAAPLMVRETVKEPVKVEPKELPKETVAVTSPQPELVAVPVITEPAPPVVISPKEAAKAEGKPAESKPEPKVTEATITTTSQTVTVTPAEPIAPIEPPKTETTPVVEKPAPVVVEPPKPVPVQLPELASQAFTSRLVVIATTLPALPASLVLTELDEAPAPPPVAIPKPALSPATAATQASTEPTVTVRYDELPAKPSNATGGAPIGDSGHANTPSANGRPRRVAPANETPVPVEPPATATRPRRVKLPTKP